MGVLSNGNDCEDPANRCVPTVCGISFCILVLFWSSFMQSAFRIGWSQDESELIILWCKPMMSDSAEIIYDVLRLDTCLPGSKMSLLKN